MNVHNWKDPIPFVAPEKSEPTLDCDEAVVKFLYLDPGQESGMSRLLLKFVQQALLVEQATQPWPSVQGRG